MSSRLATSLRCDRPARLLLPLAVLLGVVSGCAEEPRFRANSVHKLTLEKELLDGEPISDDQMKQVGNILTALFGTPSDPHFPAGYEDLVSLDLLRQAAGPVSSDRTGSPQGLYREHCVHCHGITGDGAGPTASFLNPYPRDFRLGKFKFKSTRLYRPPTDEDLRGVLIRGIAGTAMPSFALLEEEELEVLVDYVKYLAIRGQVERKLLEELTALEPDEALLSPGPAEDEAAAEEREYQLELVMEVVIPVLSRWEKAAAAVVPVPEIPGDFEQSRARYDRSGRQLFFGKANCVQCHGPTGVGDGQTENYDDWTNEWLKRANVDLNSDAEVQEFLDAGALRPRKIRPRNLRHRVLRGGSRPQDIFRRIRGGIEGTSMPAATNLSDEEVWALVAYVMELPYSDELEETHEH